MSKILKSASLVLAILTVITCSVTKSKVYAAKEMFKDTDTRKTISVIEETSSNINSIPVYGGTIVRPEFTVIKGAPAHISLDAMGWQKETSEDWWENVYSGTFTAGTWRYASQVRIEGENAKEYKLGSPITLKVNGVSWNVDKTHVYDTFSSVYVSSPEFVIEESSELVFGKAANYTILENYVGNPIEPYSVVTTVNGGKAPYTFSKTSGPGWITVSPSGMVSGTPKVVGENISLVIRVTDSDNQYKEISVNVGKTTLKEGERQIISAIEETASDFDSILVFDGTIKTPDFVVTKGTPAHIDLDSMGWQKKTGENWWETVYSGKFTEGTWRYASQIRIDGEYGGLYQLDNAVTLKVNGESWNVDRVNVEKTFSSALVTSPEYTIKASDINHIGVSILAPVAGSKPSYDVTFTQSENFVKLRNNNSNGYVNGVCWIDVSYRNQSLSQNDVFQAGHQYKVSIQLVPATTTKFQMKNGDVDANVEINELPVDYLVGNASMIGFDYTFPILENEKITDLSLNVSAPVVGNKATKPIVTEDSEIAKNHYGFWHFDDNYTANWYVNGKLMKESDIFESGKSYEAVIGLTPVTSTPYFEYPNYEFAVNSAKKPNVNVLVNGQKVTQGITGSSMYIEIRYIFETAKAELSSIKVTVPPTKTEYVQGESFNKAGMIVTATYQDNTSEEVSNYYFMPNGSLSINDKKVTISYTYGTITKTTDIAITVTQKETEMPENPVEQDPIQTPEEQQKETPWKNASEWAEKELEKANDENLIPWIFENEDLTINITRREFAYVAVKLYEKISNIKLVEAKENPFTDTNDIEVLKAYNIGITNGTSETTFDPNALITREQMATMMTRALAKAGIDTTVDLGKVSQFADDNEMHEWGRASIYYMSNIDIIKGMGDNIFGVDGKATREQSLLISERSAEKFVK